MIMENGLDIRPSLIDRSMHRRLTVGFAGAFEFVSLTIDDDQIAHGDFSRRHMRRAQYTPIGQTCRDMTVPVDDSLLLQTLANHNHLFFYCLNWIVHRFSFLGLWTTSASTCLFQPKRFFTPCSCRNLSCRVSRKN